MKNLRKVMKSSSYFLFFLLGNIFILVFQQTPALVFAYISVDQIYIKNKVKSSGKTGYFEDGKFCQSITTKTKIFNHDLFMKALFTEEGENERLKMKKQKPVKIRLKEEKKIKSIQMGSYNIVTKESLVNDKVFSKDVRENSTNRNTYIKNVMVTGIGLGVGFSTTSMLQNKALKSGKINSGQPIENINLYSLPVNAIDERKNNADSDTTSAPSQYNKSNNMVGNNEILQLARLSEEKRESASKAFISGLAGGAASRITKEIVLHPIDTVKTRVQVKLNQKKKKENGEVKVESENGIYNEIQSLFGDRTLYNNLYVGLVAALVGGLPSGALFFGVKDVTKQLSRDIFPEVLASSKVFVTLFSVLVANIPYWLIRAPSEIVKTRQQAGINSTKNRNSVEVFQNIIKEEGIIKGLYSGYTSNIVYAYPVDAIKFLTYEFIKQSWKDWKQEQMILHISVGVIASTSAQLSPLEAAFAGSVASCIAQVLTTPLDVIRTRIMTDDSLTIDGGANQAKKYSSVKDTLDKIIEEEGIEKLFSGSIPRFVRAFVSGAAQFGSYEFVKLFLSSTS